MSNRKHLRERTNRELEIENLETRLAELRRPPDMYQKDFLELLEYYQQSLTEKEFASNTVRKYMRNARWFIENFTSNDDPLNKEDVIEFKSHIQSEYNKVSTINSYITTVNRFISFCEQKEFIVAKVKGQDSNVLKDRIYDYEVKAMYTRAKQIGDMKLYLMIKVLARTGIRVAERTSITVEAANNLYAEVTNKGKTRYVPIRKDLASELRAYAKKNSIDKGIILSMEYKEIYRGLKDVAGMCKIKKSKVHPHALRHYFGFRYVELGGNIANLADLLGHSSTDTTRVYTKGTLADLQRQTEVM